MSRHSQREQRIVAAYLEQRDGVEYSRVVFRNGHYHHEFSYHGETGRYSHGGQRSSTPTGAMERDIERGVSSFFRATRRDGVADQWDRDSRI
jgi:hypothetical protein